MKLCPVCQVPLSDEAAKCTSCGQEQVLPEYAAPSAPPRERPRWLLPALLLAAAALGFGCWFKSQPYIPDPLAIGKRDPQLCRKSCVKECRTLWMGENCSEGGTRFDACLSSCRSR